MACLDHVCKKCGAEWSDNRWPRVCPKCGSRDGWTWSDEVPEKPDVDDR